MIGSALELGLAGARAVGAVAVPVAAFEAGRAAARVAAGPLRQAAGADRRPGLPGEVPLPGGGTHAALPSGPRGAPPAAVGEDGVIPPRPSWPPGFESGETGWPEPPASPQGRG